MTNQYFWEFIKNNFSHLDTRAVDQIPVIDFEIPDKQILTDIHFVVKDLLDHFQLLPGSKMNKTDDWFQVPTQQGHSHLPVVSIGEEKQFLLHSSEVVKREDEIKFNTKQEYVTSGLKDAIDKLNVMMPIKDLCDIHVCEPGGWLHPHLDIKDDESKLRIWIPLHEFPACLKVFPFGWLKHEFGKAYLFDNKNYVHAVHNPTDLYRFVLIMGIDNINPPEWIAEQLERNKSNWRQLFSQEYPG